MDRILCAQLVQAMLSPEDLVVCSLGSVNRTWRSLEPQQATYYCSDPMGLSVSIAMGLALARPDRRVTLLCGDGDLLMSLQSLATLAGAALLNLRVVVFNNGRYETGGSQPLASPDLSFAMAARGMGVKWAEETGEQEVAAQLTHDLFETPGPALLAFRVDRTEFTYGPASDLSQAEERTLFMQKLTASA
jgi:thiamine pyrophosphate-dependent acetolactate synthase large subunit-like protein